MLSASQRRELGAGLRAQLLLRRPRLRRFAVAAAGENAHYLWDPASLSPTTVYILSEKTAKWQDEPVEVTRYEKQ